jgi:hypothetical protein
VLGSEYGENMTLHLINMTSSEMAEDGQYMPYLSQASWFATPWPSELAWSCAKPRPTR